MGERNLIACKTIVSFVIGAICLAAPLTAISFQPRTGHWNNIQNESGRGFNIDIQDGVMVLTMYAYDQSGNAQWYIATGNMTNGQRDFTGALEKFVGGQCVTCGYKAPQSNGNDGTISVTFTTEVSATVILPGGRVTSITPFNFKYGDPPLGVLGSWVFTQQVAGVGFADFYTYTHVAPISNAETTGQIVLNAAENAGCVYFITGSSAGTVVCAHAFNATGSLFEGYIFKYGLDETFDGRYVTLSGAVYAMKGFRTGSASGYTRARDKEVTSMESMVEDIDAQQAPADLVNALQNVAVRLKQQR